MADCRICVQDCSIHEDVWKALKENCRNYKPKPMTNADRIRSMSDEELAKFCGKDVDACPPGRDSGKCIDELYARGEGPCPSDKQCIECWSNWLKQEGE